MTIETRNLYAYIGGGPLDPKELHVVVEVYVPNPSIAPVLLPNPDEISIDPTILRLDLYLIEEPWTAPDVLIWKQARFNKLITPGTPEYRIVEILYEEQKIGEVDVVIIN